MSESYRAPRVGFLIVGAQKAGTTALSRFLGEHPEIFLPQREIHFFDDDKRDWRNAIYDDYDRFFQGARSGQMIGEKTPIYMYWDQSPHRIREYNSAVKLIVSLRNPARRAYSHWRMETLRGREAEPFGFAIRDGRRRVTADDGDRNLGKRIFSYVERGFYAPQIRRLQSLFPPDQILYLENEALAARPHSSLDRICAFLGVRPFAVYPENRSISPNFARLGPSSGPGDAIPPADGNDLDYLAELYREDTEETEKLTGLRLDDWKSSR